MDPDTAATRIQTMTRSHLAQLAAQRKRLASIASSDLTRLWLYWNPGLRKHMTTNDHMKAVAKGYDGICSIGWVYKTPSNSLVEVNGGQRGGELLGYAERSRRPGTVPLMIYYSTERDDHLMVCNKETKWIRDASKVYKAPYTYTHTVGYILQNPSRPATSRGIATIVKIGRAPWCKLLLSFLPFNPSSSGCRGAVHRHAKKPVFKPRPPVNSKNSSLIPPESRTLGRELVVDKAKEALFDLLHKKKLMKLSYRQQEDMAFRLHEAHRVKLMKMNEKVSRMSAHHKSTLRFTASEERDCVERMYYTEAKKAAETAQRLNAQYVQDSKRYKLTKEAQDTFNERLVRNAEHLAERKKRRMEALQPPGPPNGFTKRRRSWSELHARELHENVPVPSRTVV